MTWAKLSDTFIDDPVLLALPRGVRLLYVESIVWSCKHETDGQVPAHVVGRITDEPEIDKAVDRLLDAGRWSRTDHGFEIVDFLENQISAEQVAKRRADERARQERSRRHKTGDHSLCVRGRYCPEGAVTRDSTRESQQESRRESPTPVPSRPVPTSREGKDGYVHPPSAVDDRQPCEHGFPGGLALTTAGTPRCPACRGVLAAS